VKKVATALVEETQRGVSVLDAYPVDLEITPKTGDENLREIGAIGNLLIDLIRDVCGLSGRITVEESPDGVRVRIEPGEAEPHSYALSRGG
jgi:hypothetical protein